MKALSFSLAVGASLALILPASLGMAQAVRPIVPTVPHSYSGGPTLPTTVLPRPYTGTTTTVAPLPYTGTTTTAAPRPYTGTTTTVPPRSNTGSDSAQREAAQRETNATRFLERYVQRILPQLPIADKMRRLRGD